MSRHIQTGQTTVSVGVRGYVGDGVLDELGNRFKRIRLRERDDRDGVPIVPYAQFATHGLPTL